jgi:hypothetical protein
MRAREAVMRKGFNTALITTGTKRSFYSEESAREFVVYAAEKGYVCDIREDGEEGAAWVVTVLNPALPDQSKFKAQ